MSIEMGRLCMRQAMEEMNEISGEDAEVSEAGTHGQSVAVVSKCPKHSN